MVKERRDRMPERIIPDEPKPRLPGPRNEIQEPIEFQEPITVWSPGGRAIVQGSKEDRATWWQCGKCWRHGPFVGMGADGKRCMGSRCGGVKENPNVPGVRKPGLWQRVVWLVFRRRI
jgi:hypothetical protein